MCRQLIEIIDFSMVVWQLNCRGYCKIINLTKDKRDYSYLKKKVHNTNFKLGKGVHCDETVLSCNSLFYCLWFPK